MSWGVCAAIYFVGKEGPESPLTAMPELLAVVLPMGVIGLFTAGMCRPDVDS